MEKTLLNYEIIGEGPLLVICHGLFGSLSNWRSIAKSLSSKFSVCLLDLRNHGVSFHNDEMSYEDMAKDVMHLLDYLKIKSTYLIGHSMGGKVAMTFCENYSSYVKKMIVVDIAPKKYEAHHNAILTALNTVDIVNAKSISEVDTNLSLFISSKMLRQFLLKSLKKRDLSYYWQFNVPIITKFYDSLVGITTLKKNNLTPTLFIKGEHSNYILNEDEASILTYYPNSRITSFSNAGHWLHAEKPTEFVEVVSTFLEVSISD